MVIDKNSIAFVVDDKTKQRGWGEQVLKSIGYDASQIVSCYYGDDAFKKYQKYIAQNYKVDIVLTDYHMDVKRKPPQDFIGSIKNAEILDGMTLVQRIQEIDPKQKAVVVSCGLDQNLIDIAQKNNVPALFKRQPADKKFDEYIQAVKQVLSVGEVTPELSATLLNINKYSSST